MALILLTLALRTWRRLGASVGARFEPALPVPLGRWRLPLLALVFLMVGIGSLLPVVALVWGTGSWVTLLAQIEQAWPTLLRTLGLAASVMVALALPLAWLARGLRRPWRLDALLIVPLALPAMLYGIGLIRVWNRPLLDLVYLGAPILLMAMAGRCLAFVYLPLSGALERLGPASWRWLRSWAARQKPDRGGSAG
jgi:iron(III) transport system permease protein